MVAAAVPATGTPASSASAMPPSACPRQLYLVSGVSAQLETPRRDEFVEAGRAGLRLRDKPLFAAAFNGRSAEAANGVRRCWDARPRGSSGKEAQSNTQRTSRREY